MTIRPMTPAEHREYIRAGEILERGDRIRLRALNRTIEHARDTFRKWGELDGTERAGLVAEQLRGFATEINHAYLEQRANRVNHRLSADDVGALWSLADWAAYELEIAKWRRDAENDAAWQMFERFPGDVTDDERKRLDTAPKRPSKPKADAPVGCPRLPTVDAPVTWWELVNDFLATRRGRRFEEANDGE